MRFREIKYHAGGRTPGEQSQPQEQGVGLAGWVRHSLPCSARDTVSRESGYKRATRGQVEEAPSVNNAEVVDTVMFLPGRLQEVQTKALYHTPARRMLPCGTA